MDEHNDGFTGAHDVENLINGIPARLAALLRELPGLTAEGRDLALGTVGPGSRLVLESLGVADRTTGGLTELGSRVCAALAERGPGDTGVDIAAEIIDMYPRLRRIASVSARADQPVMAAATNTHEDEDDLPLQADYDLYGDRPGEPRLGAVDASVLAMRSGEDLLVWQQGGPASVVLRASGEALPSMADEPAVITQVAGLPPSVVLRDHLAIREPDDA